MESIQYKINASMSMLSEYGLQEIKNNVIPGILSKRFQTSSSDDFILSPIQALDDNFYADYQRLLELTDKIVEQYSRVLKNFVATGGVSYPKEYIDLVAEAKGLRKNLVSRYKFLSDADRLPQIDNIELGFQTNYKVGTGLNHIKRMRRIADLLDSKNYNLNNTPKRASYSNRTESVAIQDDKQNVFVNARVLERELNDAIRESRIIGQFTVNPMYETLSLYDIRRAHDVTVSISYPNGDIEKEYSILEEAAVRTKSEGGIDITFKSADQQSIQQQLIPVSQKGYLRDIRTKMRSMIDIEKSIFKRKE